MLVDVAGTEGKYPNSWVRLWIFQNTMYTFMMKRGEEEDNSNLVEPQKWHHLCVALNGTSLEVTGVVVCSKTSIRLLFTSP